MEQNQNNEQQNVQDAVKLAMYEEKENKKKKRKKTIGIIVGVLAVIIVLSVIFGDSGDESSTTVSPADSSSQNTAVQTTSLSEQKIYPGNTVTTDNLKIIYTSCNANATDYSIYADIPSGYKVIRVDFEVENISSSDQYAGTFECYADGEKCEENYMGNDYKSFALESISSGHKISGTYYYNVPSSAEEIIIEAEESYLSDAKLNFVVE